MLHLKYFGIEDIHIDVLLVNIPQLLANWLNKFDEEKHHQRPYLSSNDYYALFFTERKWMKTETW